MPRYNKSTNVLVQHTRSGVTEGRTKRSRYGFSAATVLAALFASSACSSDDSIEGEPGMGFWGSPQAPDTNLPMGDGNTISESPTGASANNDNGGGGEPANQNGVEDPEPVTSPEATEPTTTVANADYCAPTEGWDPAWVALENDILEQVNARRAEGATCGGEYIGSKPPLTLDPALLCAARIHSLDMAERNFFSHDNPDGEGPRERMTLAGYDGRGWAENIAAGSDTAAGTMDQWMSSSGHCSNIMGDHTLIGIGYYPGGEYGTLWTQTFGR